MLKNYTLTDGSMFKTVTIPKGTVLFHGMNLENNDPRELFYNNFGFKGEKSFQISQTTNVFFYPVPYVALSVDYFTVHIMYLTNYDLELLLMINPSIMYRDSPETKIKLVEVCDQISETDKCGFKMNDYDPCFTDFCIKNYKNIDGYIAIANTDHKRFIKQYRRLFSKYRAYTKLIQILPALTKDKSGRIGIPEIVLHPLHRRREECHSIPGRNYISSSKIISYSIRNITKYNYFPLLYFTNNGVFHIMDLMKKKLLERALQEPVQNEHNIYYILPLFDLIEIAMERFLSSNGIIIKGVKYNLTVDLRTGFYIVKINRTNEQLNDTTIVNFWDIDHNTYEEYEYSIPITYNRQKKYDP